MKIISITLGVLVIIWLTWATMPVVENSDCRHWQRIVDSTEQCMAEPSCVLDVGDIRLYNKIKVRLEKCNDNTD